MDSHDWAYAILALIVWLSSGFVFMCVFHLFEVFQDKDDDE